MRVTLPPWACRGDGFCCILLCRMLCRRWSRCVGMLIASGAVVEQVFSLRGVGSYLLAAITAADTNAVSACMLVIAALYLICEMLGELLLHALCPWRDEGGADI